MYIYNTHICIYIKIFISCLAAQRLTLGQCLGDSLTNLILITAFFLILVTIPRSPGAS